jgi:hypothetical protein
VKGLSGIGALGVLAFAVNAAGGYKASSAIAALKHLLRVFT